MCEWKEDEEGNVVCLTEKVWVAVEELEEWRDELLDVGRVVVQAVQCVGGVVG